MSARERRAKAKRRAQQASRSRMLPVVLATSATLGLAGPELATANAVTFTPSQVKDINLIHAGSRPLDLTPVGSTLFFSAYKPGIGRELWKSDGTSAGTVLVRNIDPGPSGSYPKDLTDVSGTLFFAANDGSHGFELWKSDGTASGTVMVKDIDRGSAN